MQSMKPLRVTAFPIAAALAFSCVIALAPAEADEAGSDPLEPLRFLVGYCWQAPFPDGEDTDIHCYSDMFGGAFIRDRHIVRGKRPDYHGETIYQPDKETGAIAFRYWNSLGGVSDGGAVPIENGVAFPGEVHIREDGSKVEMRSTIVRKDDDRYLSVTEELVDGTWRELWRMEFVKQRQAVEDGPAARQQADKLAVFEKLIGDWADPEHAAAAKKSGEAPELQQSYRWGPRRMLIRVFEGPSASFTGEPFDPVLEGMVFWDHQKDAFVFNASTRYGWTFTGEYRVTEDGAIERTYDVHYADGEEYIPDPEIAGFTRRFREVYVFDGDDAAAVTLEIRKDDRWQPFGPGTYRLVRVD